MKHTAFAAWFVLSSLACALPASADTVFPVSSLRPQVDDTCWAYGAAHMLEGRFERRENMSVATDIQKSYLYWQIYDRLENDVFTKQASSGLEDVGGFSADYFEILAHHGFEIFHTETKPKHPSFEWDGSVGFLLQAPTYANRLKDQKSLDTFEQSLLSSPPASLADADAKITTALGEGFQMGSPLSATTPWVTGGNIPVSQVYTNMMGTDLATAGGTYTPYTFVLLTSSYAGDHGELDGKWLRYDDNRLWAIGMTDMQKMMAIARLSMDRGWPVTFETSDHVMTGLGYQELPIGQDSLYAYAVSDSSGAYFDAGMSWQSESDVLAVVTDITVFYPALQDQLPAPGEAKLFANPSLATAYVSVKIPRRH